VIYGETSGVILDFKRNRVERHDHFILADVILNLRNGDVAVSDEG
jgi:hypothetical protein